MTNTDSLPADFYNAVETASGRLSHKGCTHPSTTRERHNCRLETARKNWGKGPKNVLAHLDDEPIVIVHMN